MRDSNMIEDDGFITVHPKLKSDEEIKTDTLPRHGSPQDRGSADAYYGRRYNPHYYVGNTLTSEKVEKEDMTESEIEAYRYGYENETDRKEW